MGHNQKISLLITSGNGPEECCLAVGHVLNRMQAEADTKGLMLDLHKVSSKQGFKSVVVVVNGSSKQQLAKNWVGTIQWVAKSELRPNHKRQNWFVGVVQLETASRSKTDLQTQDVSFESFRAGGPGGQHQNTTDSAVRAVHRPTGIAVVAREMRSQHRNKAVALERLQQIFDAQTQADQQASKAIQNQHHNQLERGNPVRCFKGEKFREVKCK